MSNAGTKVAHHPRTSRADCAHHWVIETPSGPTSKGLCARCGAEEDFPNYVQYPPGQDIRFKTRQSHDPGDQKLRRPAFRTAGRGGGAGRKAGTGAPSRPRAGKPG